MNENYSDDYSYLDKVRVNEGIDKCRTVFRETYEIDKTKAVDLVNDQRLTFTCLFILKAQIKVLNLVRYLSLRNSTALAIIDQIRMPQEFGNGADYLSNKKVIEYSTLKWILETGYVEDGLNDEYEEILDVTVSVLLGLYIDTSILPIVAGMIFKRNKIQHNINDLVWAFFQPHDPNALKLIAQRIRSFEQQDVELAYHLLNIKAAYRNGVAADHQKQYETYLQWLEENDPFLFFTGESFQFSSEPAFCGVDLERKYLHKGIQAYNKQPIIPADEDESKYLEAFQSLSHEEQTVLSEHSYNIRHRSLSEWKKWMEYPIKEQIRVAIAERERTHDYNV